MGRQCLHPMYTSSPKVLSGFGLNFVFAESTVKVIERNFEQRNVLLLINVKI
jgi:hypothetical protein